MATSVKKLRIETWFTKSESHFIRMHICKEKESRKEAIERIVRREIDKTKAKIQSL